jgi:AmmeMemoRadiSam system protein A
MSIAYVGRARGTPGGGDDAAEARAFALERLPSLCFDHDRIVRDYRRFLETGELPSPAGCSALLDPPERDLLLRIARDALECAARGAPPARFPGEERGVLAEERSCFVTLRRRQDHALRGCIGNLVATRPLAESVREMTAAAALRDPRFSPVATAEVEELAIGVSVLSPARRVTDPSEVRVGAHGVVVGRGGNRGVLLPQVASEQGWDRDTFLAHTCVKAGLPPDAWRDPDTEIQVFEADVFGED